MQRHVTKSVGLTVGGCVALLALSLGYFCLVSLAFMGLWNWLVPALFHGPVLSYWMALGLILLLSFIGGLLFGNHKRAA